MVGHGLMCRFMTIRDKEIKERVVSRIESCGLRSIHGGSISYRIKLLPKAMAIVSMGFSVLGTVFEKFNGAVVTALTRVRVMERDGIHRSFEVDFQLTRGLWELDSTSDIEALGRRNAHSG